MPQKYCRKFEPPEQGARTLQTTDRQTDDRRQTDGRAIAYSEREREFTFAKNCQRQSCSAINCLSSGINILTGGSSIPLISERKGTDPHYKHVRCTHFALQHGRRERYRKQFNYSKLAVENGLSKQPSTKVLRRPYFPPEIGCALSCQRMLAFLLFQQIQLQLHPV